MEDIINVLNIIGSIPNLNHMFYPGGGGMDLLKVELATEPDCIALYTGLWILLNLNDYYLSL